MTSPTPLSQHRNSHERPPEEEDEALVQQRAAFAWQQSVKSWTQSTSKMLEEKKELPQDRLLRFLLSDTMECLVCSLVVVDLLVLFYGVHDRSSGNARPQWILIVHTCFLCLFLVEIVLACGFHRFNLANKHWLVVDMAIILVSVVGACVQGPGSHLALLPRMIRVYRLVHMKKGIAQSKILVLTVGMIAKSASFFLCSLLLLLTHTVMFSVLVMELVQPKIKAEMGQAAMDQFSTQVVQNCHDAFSSFMSSMSTLFALSMGDQWHDVALPIIWVVPEAFPIFVSYVLFASVILVGSIYAVLHESMTDYKNEQTWLSEEEKLKQRGQALHRLRKMFHAMDVNSSGTLTWQELHHLRATNAEFIRILEILDVKADDLDDLWDVLDRDGNGEVSEEEFVDTMEQLQSGETKVQVMRTHHCTSRIYARLTLHQKQTQQGFAILQSLLTEQQKTLDVLIAKDPSISEAGHAESGEQQQEIETLIAQGHDLDAMSETAKMELACQFMCSVGADSVSNHSRTDVVDFWAGQGGGNHIDIAADRSAHACERADFFVSHCWSSPDNWHTYFKRTEHDYYENKKAVELHNILTTAMEDDMDCKSSSVSEITPWRGSSSYGALEVRLSLGDEA